MCELEGFECGRRSGSIRRQGDEVASEDVGDDLPTRVVVDRSRTLTFGLHRTDDPEGRPAQDMGIVEAWSTRVGDFDCMA